MFFIIRIIFDSLNVEYQYYWVGFEDESSEGNWQWINGRRTSTEETALWANGEPSGGRDRNCAYISVVNLFMLSYPCPGLSSLYALCQKPM